MNGDNKMTADAALAGMMQHIGWWFDAHDARKQMVDADVRFIAGQLYDVIRTWRMLGCPGVVR